MLPQIIPLLKEILTELIAIRTALHNSSIQQLPIEEELLDNSDAMRLLKISDKTLYLWRKDKLINTRMIGRKHYYVKAELVKLMKKV